MGRLGQERECLQGYRPSYRRGASLIALAGFSGSLKRGEIVAAVFHDLRKSIGIAFHVHPALHGTRSCLHAKRCIALQGHQQTEKEDEHTAHRVDSMISRRLGRRGTGCWTADINGYVHLFIKSFDDGVVRETKIHNSKFVSRGEDQAPPSDVRKLIKQVDDLDSQCRGGSGDSPKTMAACEKRDKAFDQITQKGGAGARLNKQVARRAGGNASGRAADLGKIIFIIYTANHASGFRVGCLDQPPLREKSSAINDLSAHRSPPPSPHEGRGRWFGGPALRPGVPAH